MPVGGATSVVALSYTSLGSQAFYNRLTPALTSPTISAADIEKWGTSVGLSLPAQRPSPFSPNAILIVWSRYSGQNGAGGYNPAGDSDSKGQKDLIQRGKDLGLFVITIGHDPTGSETPRGDIHLGEFWRQEGSPFVGQGRPGQGSMYARLVALEHQVVQVGQKTGGMDNAALLGLPTVYIEDADSSAIARMRKWSDRMLRYKPAVIDLPPTRVGKAIRAYEKTHGPWSCTLARARRMVEEDPASYPAGYSPDALDRIEGELVKMYRSSYNFELKK